MHDTPRVFLISGPPASGKTTLCSALLNRFEKAIHIPVDDLRLWVCRGLSESVPWTDETERQFQIAEAATSDVALRYASAGFSVAIDHCRNPQRMERVARDHLQGADIVKICLMPDLEVNLHRSHTRTNKSFDPHLLDDTIRFTNEHYRLGLPDGWLVIDNSRMDVDQTVELILAAPLI